MSTVLVSGGSKGLGAGLVQAFLERGDTVATFSRSSSEQVEQWAAEYGERFYFAPLDLTDRAATAAWVKAMQAVVGDVDVLVNNAGMAYSRLLALADDDGTDQVVDLNLKGTVQLTRLISRPMLTMDGAVIINISSIVG